jgi:hypothetical protein
MMSARNRLLAIAAFTILAIIHPGTVSAQTSGVGGDGFTRLLWVMNGDMVLWKLDPNLNMVASKDYGSFPGYDLIGITTAPNNNTYVLWSYHASASSGNTSITLWLVDANLNFITSRNYGPLPLGWIPTGLSAGGSSPNFQVIWSQGGTAMAVWIVDANLNYVTSASWQQPGTRPRT